MTKYYLVESLFDIDTGPRNHLQEHLISVDFGLDYHQRTSIKHSKKN